MWPGPRAIRTFGEPMKFYRTTRIYLTTPMGWKHWDMQGGSITDADVTLINRGRVEHVYGAQNAPRTRSGVESFYDGLATTWDAQHGMTAQEKTQTTALIRDVFRDRLGRTLDVGCGTGWPLDEGLVDPVRYVGIDPSTGMLNALVAKHPHLAGVHPMTFAQAVEQKVLCGTRFDTVLALGGSASYLSPEDITAMRQAAKGALLLMHHGPDSSTTPADLDAVVDAASLDAAAQLATSRTQVGRYVATVIA
jgi:SAM-dependent methyltransferase